MKNIFKLLFFVSFFATNAQEIKNYKWDEKPVFSTIGPEYDKDQAVVLFDKRWVHTRVGGYSFASFTMNHVAIKIKTQDAISRYNKVKAENGGFVRDLRDFHARVIKPNGTINVLPESSIVQREIDKIKSVVFEGVEAGDILEYYYIIKENPSAYGVEIFQRDIPVLQAIFSCSKYGVDFNVYAHSSFQQSYDSEKSNYIANNIPAIKEEIFSNNIENLVKLIFNIHVNGAGVDYALWDELMKASFKKPSFSFFKKGQARDFTEKLALDGLPIDEKITKLDLYIKENFDFVTGGESAKKVKNLNEGKIKLTASDVFDLYGFALKESKINYLVVAGLNKDYGPINMDRLVKPLSHEFVYYIPETKKFLSPYEKQMPYGSFSQYELQNTTGITYDRAEGVIDKMIFPEAPANFTTIDANYNLVLNDDLSTAKLEKTVSSTGYFGQIERYYAKYLKENEEEKETLDYLKKRIFGDLDVSITNYVFENQEFKNTQTNAPFITKLKVDIKETITENAGNLLLVNIGKIIGKQNNLYQENQRLTDINLNYNKIFKHQIKFQIPGGYAVESFNDLVIDKKMNYDLDKNCYFKSTAKVEGKTLIIEIDEQYKSVFYPKTAYQEYRKVVNAASDFAKATLVLKQIK